LVWLGLWSFSNVLPAGVKEPEVLTLGRENPWAFTMGGYLIVSVFLRSFDYVSKSVPAIPVVSNNCPGNRNCTSPTSPGSEYQGGFSCS
jgi:hypothetical protein